MGCLAEFQVFQLNRKSKDVIAKLIARGQLVTINQPLRHEDAIEVAKEFE